MNDIEYIKTQEAILCIKLGFENNVSISIKQLSDFYDAICLKANKTNASLTVLLNYDEKSIYFWNDCDEKFIQPLNQQGIDFIVNAIKNEFEQTYYFQVKDPSQRISSFIVKIDGAVDIETIRSQAIELKQNTNWDFDYIKVFNFIGSKRYIVKFNEDGVLCEKVENNSMQATQCVDFDRAISEKANWLSELRQTFDEHLHDAGVANVQVIGSNLVLTLDLDEGQTIDNIFYRKIMKIAFENVSDCSVKGNEETLLGLYVSRHHEETLNGKINFLFVMYSNDNTLLPLSLCCDNATVENSLVKD